MLLRTLAGSGVFLYPQQRRPGCRRPKERQNQREKNSPLAISPAPLATARIISPVTKGVRHGHHCLDRGRPNRGIAPQYAPPRHQLTGPYLHRPDRHHRGPGRRLDRQPVPCARPGQLPRVARGSRRSSGPAAGLPSTHPATRRGRQPDSPLPDTGPLGHTRRIAMKALIIIVVVVVVLLVIGVALSARVIKQYQQGVLFRLGRVQGPRAPGFRLIIPLIDVLHRVSLRIVTMPIQSQGIITRDNVSVDVSAVAYFRVVDAVKSVVAIENVKAAIGQIAQTTLRKVVGQHTLDETLSETDRINVDIREILDVTTAEWGVEVTLVEMKDIQLPDSMKRAMARQAEAEREKRAKIINAEGESLAAAALGDASDTMMAHPLALQLRNLQSLVEIGVDKNTTVVFPAPLMTTIAELGSFLARESAAATPAASATVPTVARAPLRMATAVAMPDPDQVGP